MTKLLLILLYLQFLGIGFLTAQNKLTIEPYYGIFRPTGYSINNSFDTPAEFEKFNSFQQRPSSVIPSSVKLHPDFYALGLNLNYHYKKFAFSTGINVGVNGIAFRLVGPNAKAVGINETISDYTGGDVWKLPLGHSYQAFQSNSIPLKAYCKIGISLDRSADDTYFPITTVLVSRDTMILFPLENIEGLPRNTVSVFSSIKASLYHPKREYALNLELLYNHGFSNIDGAEIKYYINGKYYHSQMRTSGSFVAVNLGIEIPLARNFNFKKETN